VNLLIATIQANLIWEDRLSNLAFFEKAFEEVDKNTTLVILPEMFTTGFSMNPKKLAEPMDGSSILWLKRQSNKFNTYICGSLIIEEKGRYFNRLIVVSPHGWIKSYDKKHLFRYSNENSAYSAGNSQLIVEIEGVKIAFYVCYDLRFPVWSRNYELKYDTVIYIANWPEERRAHWIALLKARAIENQAYVIGVNRIGIDGNGIKYSGDTGVYSPLGVKISTTKPFENKVESIALNMEELNDYRVNFPTHLDADKFNLL
jgi:predicted amidohydrolase